MKKLSTDKIKNMLWSLKSNTKAILTIFALLLFLDAVIILRGQLVTVLLMFKEANKLKASINSAIEDARFFSTYKGRVGDLQAELKNFDKMSVTEYDLPQVIESISKFANISGVRIFKIKPILKLNDARDLANMHVPVDETEKFTRQKFSITARSGFHELGRFVALMENSTIFIDIKSIEIRTDEREPTKHLITILLEVVLGKI